MERADAANAARSGATNERVIFSRRIFPQRSPMDERETNLESAAPRLDASSPCSSSGRVRGGVGVVVRAGARPGSGARPLAGSHRASHLVVPSHASSTVSPRCASSTNMATRARLLAVVDPRGCPRGDWKVRTRAASERARAPPARDGPRRARRATRTRARLGGARGGRVVRARRDECGARASSGARQRPTRGVIFAREAPSARSARGPARETDAPRRIDIDRDRVSPVGVAGAAGEPDAKHPRPRAHFRARRRPPVFPASGLASPRLAEHPRSVARARPGPLPRLPPLARGFAIVASVRVSSVPTSKGLESTR